MTILEQHYDFKLKSDQVDSLSKRNFLPAEIDWLLNESEHRLITQRMGIGNPKFTGFENTQKRIDDLKNIHVRFPVQPALTPTLSSGIYEINLADLTYPYMYMTRVVGTYTSDGCTTVDIPFKPVQTDDLTDILIDPFNKPHKYKVPFTYGQSTSGTTGSIFIHPAGGVVSDVKVEYIRKPTRVNLGGYLDILGVLTTTQDSELSEHLHTEIVNMAVALATRIMNDPATPLFQEYANTQE